MLNSRTLIFVVAYNAESTLAAVLDRIPRGDLGSDLEVLVIDDSSRDRTFEIALEYKECASFPLTVLRTPVNQGYGGNQKLGYRYAIESGFDAVVLLHGDGQYAPEHLPSLIEPIGAGRADAVFGSRMLEPGSARRGGMPLYKWIGNRILSTFQNRALGTSLSEFHSGYRAYSVDGLRRIPFEANTNDFHFDTEIIIQLLIAGLRIEEVPIPTYYGDEICHVNGMAYAWNVVRTTIWSRLQRFGIVHHPRFDIDDGSSPYELKLGYSSSHQLAFDRIQDGERLLDIGCGPALLSQVVRREKRCHVTGVEVRVPSEPEQGDRLDVFVSHDLDAAELPANLADQYDTILLLDVLEHLRSPETFLCLLRDRYSGHRTRVLVSVPNIGFIVTRLALLLGQFNYGKRGILDLTHTRLFTKRSIARLLEESGYQVRFVRGVSAPYPLALGSGRVARALVWFNQALARLWPSLFGYQIFVEAAMAPSVRNILLETMTQDARPGRAAG